MAHQTLKYAVSLVTIICIVTAKKMYMYVGMNTENESPLKVYAFPDISFDHILINSADFACEEENSCNIISEEKTMNYLGMDLTYREAMTQINLLLNPNPEPVLIRYVLSEHHPTASILGFGPNSTFFDYFSIMNYNQGLTLIFYLDWENVVYFRGELQDYDKLPINTPLYANITFYRQSNLPPQYLRFCLSNRVDMGQHEATYFSVRKELFNDWRTILINQKKLSETSTRGLVHFNFTMQLSTADSKDVGKMEFKFDELVDDRYSILIREFDDNFDEGRGCDIYAGTSMLRKFNFRYYYAEDPNGFYRFLFGYDEFSGFDKTNRIHDEASLVWLQIVFFIIVFGFGGFIVYQYLIKKGEEVTYRDEELSIPDEDDEEDDEKAHEGKFHVTKDQIALLNKLNK